MYTLQVNFHGKWKWGIKQYDTKEAADARVAELAAVGIKSRIRLTSDLFRR